MISIIIPCCGRLEHLKLCVPAIKEQSNGLQYELTVVDYGCPDRTFQWCKSQKINAIKVLDRTVFFNLSRAKNIGARKAIGNILVFLDADVIALPLFLQEITKPITEDTADLVHIGLGTHAVSAEMYHKVRGFDERYEGWGCEAEDFYKRCKEVGARRATWFPALVKRIKHDDISRTLHYEYKNKMQSWKRNRDLPKQEINNPDGYGHCECKRYPYL